MLAHRPTKSLLMQVEDPFALRSLLPKSRTLAHGAHNLVVKHTIAATKTLRKLGMDVPAPIAVQYDWPGKYVPFDHQRVMSEFLTLNRKSFNLSEMGTGKSASTLWAADHLMSLGIVKKALILSPLSTLDRVWRQDIFDVLMHRTASMVYGSRDRRLQALATKADFYILNHDGIKISVVADMIRKDPDINLVIVDEAGMFRNHETKMYKALEKLIRPDMRLWMLTGTPCPNAPTDAWALARLVDPSRAPKFFGQFKRMTMMQISQFKWVPRVDGHTTAFSVMQPAIRFKKADCLDLPSVTTTDRQCELTKEQRDAFQAMRIKMQAETKGTKITAVNAADKINKLRQLLAGCIKDTVSGDYIDLPHGPRVQVLLDTIAEAGAKVIVIIPFKGITRALEEEVGKHYSVGVLNGDVSPGQRDAVIKAFKNTKDPHVLLCHPKVMSHGLNLTEADTTIFYAPIHSNDQFQQVTERFNRAGQTRKMTIVRMAAHPLEWEIYRLVDARKLGQDSMLDLYKSVIG